MTNKVEKKSQLLCAACVTQNGKHYYLIDDQNIILLVSWFELDIQIVESGLCDKAMI